MAMHVHLWPMGESKQPIRERIWRALEDSGDALFPGAFDRIPNFKGAEEAAERLAQTEEWKRARVLKCNPDSPQRHVRLRALRDRKIVYMAVPRLRTVRCFLALDPRRIPDLEAAASIHGARRYGVPTHPADMSQVDLIVCGSVAVDSNGVRVGKGAGYSDLEFALARQLGIVTGDTPIATTLHPLQVVDQSLPRRAHDFRVTLAVTPDQVLRFPAGDQPEGIVESHLTPELLSEVPILRELGYGGGPEAPLPDAR